MRSSEDFLGHIVSLITGTMCKMADPRSNYPTLTLDVHVGARIAHTISMTVSNTNAFHVDESITSLWRAWYMAELIRRTYISIIFVHGMYQMLKQGWAFYPGGASFTVKNGLWDSPSARMRQLSRKACR